MTASTLFLAAAAAVPGGASCPPEPPPGMVARAAPFGGVVAPTRADAEAAAAAGSLALRAARRFLGLDVPPFLIAPPLKGGAPGRGGCSFVFVWRFPAPGEPRPPSHVLPHEIGHALFIRALVGRTRSDEYGGDAPDWLDEMAAMAFEDAAGVRMRRSEARRHAERGALIPLARLLVMPHPEWSAARDRPGTGAGAGAIGPPASPDTPAFYATVRALLDFLIDCTNDEAVIRRLAEQVRAHAPVERWLLERCGAGDRSAGLAGLDARLAAFVLTDRAYRRARRAPPPAREDPKK